MDGFGFDLDEDGGGGGGGERHRRGAGGAIRVTVVRNGRSVADGKVITIESAFVDWLSVLAAATARLRLAAPAVVAWNADGEVVNDTIEVEDGDVLFVDSKATATLRVKAASSRADTGGDGGGVDDGDDTRRPKHRRTRSDRVDDSSGGASTPVLLGGGMEDAGGSLLAAAARRRGGSDGLAGTPRRRSPSPSRGGAGTPHSSTSEEGEAVPAVIGPYRVGRVLGEGGFGFVRLGTHQVSGARVALKFLSKSRLRGGLSGEAERLLTEITVLTDLRHRHIVRLVNVVNTPHHFVIVLEYAAGGDLREWVRAHPHGRLPEALAWLLFRQIAAAVAFAHSQRIVHRDVKLENVLLMRRVDSVRLSAKLRDAVLALALASSPILSQPSLAPASVRAPSGSSASSGPGARGSFHNGDVRQHSTETASSSLSALQRRDRAPSFRSGTAGSLEADGGALLHSPLSLGPLRRGSDGTAASGRHPGSEDGEGVGSASQEYGGSATGGMAVSEEPDDGGGDGSGIDSLFALPPSSTSLPALTTASAGLHHRTSFASSVGSPSLTSPLASPMLPAASTAPAPASPAMSAVSHRSGSSGSSGVGSLGAGALPLPPSLQSLEEAVRVCLTDFGLSQYAAPTDVTRAQGGSLYYMAPEVVRGGSASGESADVYALGVLLYALVMGRTPFRSATLDAEEAKLRREAEATLLATMEPASAGPGLATSPETPIATTPLPTAHPLSPSTGHGGGGTTPHLHGSLARASHDANGTASGPGGGASADDTGGGTPRFRAHSSAAAGSLASPLGAPLLPALAGGGVPAGSHLDGSSLRTRSGFSGMDGASASASSLLSRPGSARVAPHHSTARAGDEVVANGVTSPRYDGDDLVELGEGVATAADESGSDDESASPLRARAPSSGDLRSMRSSHSLPFLVPAEHNGRPHLRSGSSSSLGVVAAVASGPGARGGLALPTAAQPHAAVTGTSTLTTTSARASTGGVTTPIALARAQSTSVLLPSHAGRPSSAAPPIVQPALTSRASFGGGGPASPAMHIHGAAAASSSPRYGSMAAIDDPDRLSPVPLAPALSGGSAISSGAGGDDSAHQMPPPSLSLIPGGGTTPGGSVSRISAPIPLLRARSASMLPTASGGSSPLASPPHGVPAQPAAAADSSSSTSPTRRAPLIASPLGGAASGSDAAAPASTPQADAAVLSRPGTRSSARLTAMPSWKSLLPGFGPTAPAVGSSASTIASADAAAVAHSAADSGSPAVLAPARGSVVSVGRGGGVGIAHLAASASTSALPRVTSIGGGLAAMAAASLRGTGTGTLSPVTSGGDASDVGSGPLSSEHTAAHETLGSAGDGMLMIEAPLVRRGSDVTTVSGGGGGLLGRASSVGSAASFGGPGEPRERAVSSVEVRHARMDDRGGASNGAGGDVASPMSRMQPAASPMSLLPPARAPIVSAPTKSLHTEALALGGASRGAPAVAVPVPAEMAARVEAALRQRDFEKEAEKLVSLGPVIREVKQAIADSIVTVPAGIAPTDISQQLLTLLAAMLHPDPAARISLAEVLAHEWMRSPPLHTVSHSTADVAPTPTASSPLTLPLRRLLRWRTAAHRDHGSPAMAGVAASDEAASPHVSHADRGSGSRASFTLPESAAAAASRGSGAGVASTPTPSGAGRGRGAAVPRSSASSAVSSVLTPGTSVGRGAGSASGGRSSASGPLVSPRGIVLSPLGSPSSTPTSALSPPQEGGSAPASGGVHAGIVMAGARRRGLSGHIAIPTMTLGVTSPQSGSGVASARGSVDATAEATPGFGSRAGGATSRARLETAEGAAFLADDATGDDVSEAVDGAVAAARMKAARRGSPLRGAPGVVLLAPAPAGRAATDTDDRIAPVGGRAVRAVSNVAAGEPASASRGALSPSTGTGAASVGGLLRPLSRAGGGSSSNGR